jgi:hypothetical protein
MIHIVCLGLIFCSNCASNMIPGEIYNQKDPVRVCDACLPKHTDLQRNRQPTTPRVANLASIYDTNMLSTSVAGNGLGSPIMLADGISPAVSMLNSSQVMLSSTLSTPFSPLMQEYRSADNMLRALSLNGQVPAAQRLKPLHLDDNVDGMGNDLVPFRSVILDEDMNQGKYSSL